jgi:hypothetical protein
MVGMLEQTVRLMQTVTFVQALPEVASAVPGMNSQIKD